VKLHQGRSRAPSPALSLVSIRKSSGGLVDDEGPGKAEIPIAEVYDEPIQLSESIEVDYPPEAVAEPIPGRMIIEETPTGAQRVSKSMKKVKKVKKVHLRPHPEVEPDFEF
jgi:hypothetical protein